MRTRRRFSAPMVALLFAAAAAFRPAPSPPLDPPTVVFVVRHAERIPGGDRNPPLSAAGKERADALLDALRGTRIAAVYTTQFQRTQETARPAAEHFNVSVTVVEAQGADVRQEAKALADRVLAEHRGKGVLVVGHSNTVPAIVEALGGVPVPVIGDGEFDNLFMVIAPDTGPASVVRAKYGKASTP